VPPVVEMSYIIDRLRGMGVSDDKRVIESVIGSSVSICCEGHSGPYWDVPNDEVIEKAGVTLRELVFIVSASTTYSNSNGSYHASRRHGVVYQRSLNIVKANRRLPSCAAASSDSRLIHFLYDSIAALGLSPIAECPQMV
jgi:hypothetical protein